MGGFITAMRTLTIIPLPGKEARKFSSSLAWFPCIGFILGLIIYGLGWLWLKIPGTGWPGGGAVILLMAQVVLTRGLHLDGLADWADALGGKRDQTSRLHIMKDPRVGAFGVIALIILLLIKWTVLERMLSTGSILWIVFIMVISRDMMVVLMTTLPYARPEEGMATPFVKDISTWQKIGSHTFCLVLCLLAGPVGLVFYGLGWIITWLLKGSYMRGFGGITGDLLGATNEIVEMILLLMCVANTRLILDYTGWNWILNAYPP